MAETLAPSWAAAPSWSSDSPERLVGGFQFVEGPVWQAEHSRLLFNDIPGNTAYAWSQAQGLEVLRADSHKANGQVIDILGRLIVCQHLTSSLVRYLDGEAEVLASHYDGYELNSPNDVIVAPDGSVLFTDPYFGRTEAAMGTPRNLELGFCGVYQWSESGGLRLLTTRLTEPNGLCLSLDSARLYVNDTATGEIIEFKTSWRPSGLRLDEGHLFAQVPDGELGKADGMKVDALGQVWCTGAGGIYIYSSDGEPRGFVACEERVGNFTWGGIDGHDLYLTATSSLYKLRTTVAGAAWV